MADEYIRKQDAVERMVDVIINEFDVGITYAYTLAEDGLSLPPAADIAPVVRCKDCEHYYFADNRIPQEQRYVCEISGEIWKPDSFCSYGERREE